MSLEAIKTPCIRVCMVDGQTGWCLGCGRSLSEIGNWVRMGESGRESVMDQLPGRIEALSALGKR